MKDIREASDEELNRPGPMSLADERAAEEIGIPMEQLVEMMDIWMKHSGEIARERMRRRQERLANQKRTVLN